MARFSIGRLALLIGSASILTACEKGVDFSMFSKKSGDAEVSADVGPAAATSSVKLVERDIEAPDVFQSSDAGLWDGRPSLGGVWVAHSNALEPERVIIRNQDNGKFVIGALFRRERENPGPKFQVSSDAAAALGMLAGAPDNLQVTALRRQEVPIADETASSATETLPAPGQIETASLDPIAAAGAALDKIEDVQPVSAEIPKVDPQPTQIASAAPASKPAPTSKLEKPFIQIGYFSVEQNASNTAVALRNAGVLPNVIEKESKGKTYYRVTVGPMQTSTERGSLLKKVKGLGFNDAYFVTN